MYLYGYSIKFQQFHYYQLNWFAYCEMVADQTPSGTRENHVIFLAPTSLSQTFGSVVSAVEY